MSTTSPRLVLAALTAACLVGAAAPPSWSDSEARPRAGAEARDLSAASAWSSTQASVTDPRVSIRSLAGREVEVGTPVRFQINANRDGYAHLYVVSASGRVQLWMENVPIKAKTGFRYPSGGFSITASEPEGTDRLVVILSRERVDGLAGRATTRLPQDLDMDGDELRDALETMMAEYPRTDWTWADARVEVVER